MTTTCHRNYKKCVQEATMDYCGHLMKECYETQKFVLPEPVTKIVPREKEPLIFTDEENEVNQLRCQKKQFYDQKICRHLCSNSLVSESTRNNAISPCESMCFQLSRSSDAAGEVCPLQKYCLSGCPCPFYECEKFESRQTLIPVFDLQQNFTEKNLEKTDEQLSTELTFTLNDNLYQNHFRIIIKSDQDLSIIKSRWTDRETFKAQRLPIIFSDVDGTDKQLDVSRSLFSYERFPLINNFVKKLLYLSNQ